jgi:hypothetical protein
MLHNSKLVRRREYKIVEWKYKPNRRPIEISHAIASFPGPDKARNGSQYNDNGILQSPIDDYGTFLYVINAWTAK